MLLAELTVADPLIAIPVAVASAVIAYGVIWRRGLVPVGRFLRAVNKIAEATPTLITIAEEFRPNHGTTLRDTVDRIEGKIDDAKTALDLTKDTVDTTYLSLTVWAAARDAIIGRIAVLEDRQSHILDGLRDVFATGGSIEEIVAGIKGVLASRQKG